MKKMAAWAAFIMLAAGAGRAAVRIEIGALAGTRTVTSTAIKDVYGTGAVFYPYASIHPWKGLFAGAAYEAAAARTGTIGLYAEPTTLKISGFEVFAGYEASFGMIMPYIKAGYAVYSYKQVIESRYVSDNQVDASKGTIVLGGGLKAFMSGTFFLAGEVRFVPLKVQPFDTQVDLGGLRYTAGIGVKF